MYEKLTFPFFVLVITGLCATLYSNTLTLVQMTTSMEVHSKAIEGMGVAIGKISDNKFTSEDGKYLDEKIVVMNNRLIKVEAFIYETKR